MRGTTLVFLALMACDGGGGTDDTTLGDDDDSNTSDPFADDDDDGFPAGVDCDDQNAAVNPEASEIAYDGADNDCDPATLDDDLDEDGYALASDCDDENPDVSPAAAEIQGDGIDNDCNESTCYANGFASAPTSWALPDYPQLGGVLPLGEFTESAPDCANNQPEFGLVDVTGDGQLDFVVVEEPCPGDPTVGLTEWKVYPGGATGFNPIASTWDLPPYPQTGGVLPLGELLETSPDCYNGQPEFSLMDMNGDDFVDFVVVEEPCPGDPAVGITEWKVFEGSATGFSQTATSWTLPPYPMVGGILPLGEITETAPDCANGQPEFSLMDLTGDGIVDFVVVEEPCPGDPDVGITEWKVFEGSATGFAQTAIGWTLPPYPMVGGTLPLGEISETAPDCANGQPEFVLTDIDNDGFTDFLVVEEPCPGDPTVGITEWKYFPGSASGFAQSAVAFTLPPFVQTGGTLPLGEFAETAPDCANNQPEFSVLDLDGDGLADFTVVEDPCPGDPNIGITQWEIYPGSTSGFAQIASPWALPSYPQTGGALPLGELAETSPDCVNNQPEFSLMDIDADGRLDFVVAEEPCGDPTVGITEWRVYLSACDL